MSIDGVFIHHLVNELDNIKNKRINKIYDISENEFLLRLSNKAQLILSLNLTYPHLRVSEAKQTVYPEPSNFCMLLRKYLERGIITNLTQYNNDRVVRLSIASRDELGYTKDYFLILELLGRHANLILTNSENEIIDALRRTPFDSLRLIIPRVNYELPDSNKINPFLITNNEYIINNLEGVSNLLKDEIIRKQDLLSTINQPVNPTIITNSKPIFYWFDISSIIGTRMHFNSLSEMLEYFFSNITSKRQQTQAARRVDNYLKREIKKQTRKIAKQENELLVARENLKYKELGDLLATNLYSIKPYSTVIRLENYYDNNNIIELSLDPQMSPAENLNKYYATYKKATRTIQFLEKLIRKEKAHLEYLTTTRKQLQNAHFSDLEEFISELGLRKKHSRQKQISKPNYLIFHTNENNTIFVGRNNLQNNYITHKLARSNDYFFHVKNYPGCHVIVRTEKMTPELANLAGQIAGYYSNFTAKIDVDYTLVKNVRKVRGREGSFVHYTDFQTITVEPNYEFISQHTTRDK